MSRPIHPYVAVPSQVHDSEMKAIRDFLPPRVTVLQGSEIPVMHMSGDGSEVAAVREFGYWLINFGPTELWKLSAFLLSTYFGKKLIDGYAEEAGKDLWGGIKTLLRHISGQLKTDAPPPRGVTLRGSGTTGKSPSGEETSLYLDAEIEVDLPDDECSLVDFIYCMERFALPLIGCMSAKSDVVKLRVDPRGEPFPWTWHVWDLNENMVFHADFKKSIFRPLDPNRVSKPVEDCLIRLGLRSEPV